MAGVADEAHELGQHAVVGAADGDVAVLGPRRRVHHHGHVDVVEGAQAHHLRLAAQKLELAFGTHGEPFFELDILLGGYRHEDHAPREIGRDLAQRQAGADHHRQLAVVSTRVDGARVSIVVGMLPAQQGIKLAEDGDGRPSGARLDHSLAAGQRNAVLVRHAQTVEPVVHDLRRAVLFEAQLGHGEDLLGQRFELGSVRVDGAAHARLEIGAKSQRSGTTGTVRHNHTTHADARSETAWLRARDFERAWLARHIHDERRTAGLLGEVREAVFGAQDGLISTLGVVSAVAAATHQSLPVLIAGLASALAGIFSMTAGEYMSSKSQREIFDAQIASRGAGSHRASGGGRS